MTPHQQLIKEIKGPGLQLIHANTMNDWSLLIYCLKSLVPLLILLELWHSVSSGLRSPESKALPIFSVTQLLAGFLSINIMIQIEFKGPEQKQKVIPQTKSAIKEKERLRKQKKQEEKRKQEEIKKKKLEITLQKVKETEQVKQGPLDLDMHLLKFLFNAHDPKEFTKKEEPKKPAPDDLSQTEAPDVIRKTAFLNTAEYQELKEQYSDYNMGEFVLRFPNPDWEKMQDRPITIQEAENIFDKALAIVAEQGIPQSLLKKQRKVFLNAFLSLDDYVERDPEKIKKMQEELRKSNGKKTIFNSKSPMKVEERNHAYMEYRGYMEAYGKMQSLVEEEQEIIDSQSIPKGKGPSQTPAGNGENLSKKSVASEKKVNDSKNSGYKDAQPLDVKPEGQAKDAVVEQEPLCDERNNLQQKISASEQQMKALLKLNTSDTKNYSQVQKKFCKGGYLYKQFTDDKTDYDWIQVNMLPQDFLTLIRHTIIMKLTRDAHFHCRQFISTDDQTIFVVLKSKLNKVRQIAEQQRLWKQYELGYADILSLEPCDPQLRPLRLKQYIRDPDFAAKASDFVEEPKKDGAKLSRIESEAQKIYQGVMKWGDQELRANVVLSQAKLDPLIRWMANELHISLKQEQVAIVDDRPCSRGTWEAYHIYQLYLIDYLQRVFSADQYKEVKINRGFLFKLIFRKATGDTNQLYHSFHSSFFYPDKILENLWDRQEISAIAPYGQYFTTSENQSLWRQYQVNEKGARSEFMNMEKLKIANSLLSAHINIKKLVELQLVQSYFAIHDPFQLLGMPKAGLFKPLYDLQLIEMKQQSVGQLKLNDLFVSLKDEAEGADFDGDPLAEEAKFHWCPPWTLPIDVIRDYFGEKVALYFRFLQYYSQRLWYMVVIGIICEGVIDNTVGDSKKAFIVIFSVLMMIWSSHFIAHWKREQIIFQIEFGQQYASDANDVERPAFEGDFVRSIVSDKLNEEIYPMWKKQIKLGISATITLLLVATVIASVIGVFFLKSYLLEEYPDNMFLVSIVPSLINAIVINVFNVIYASVSSNLNYKENHKFESEYEDSLITKSFFFTFINTFNCLAIIAFLNTTFENLQLCKTAAGLDCYQALKDQMITIFLVNFAKTLPQLITPCLKVFIRSETKTADENLVQHEFNQIDEYIQQQGDMEPYMSNAETDGLMNDYMELIIQFAFLQLFGLAFPASYLLAFFTNCFQLQVDKMKLIYFMQRPLPTGANDIGSWMFILEIIVFLSIFCNAGLIVFTAGIVGEGGSQTLSFVSFVLVFLAFRYVTSIAISPFPEKARLILARHKFAIERVHRGMKNALKGYNKGHSKTEIDGVDYSKMVFIQQDHILQGPNVQLPDQLQWKF